MGIQGDKVSKSQRRAQHIRARFERIHHDPMTLREWNLLRMICDSLEQDPPGVTEPIHVPQEPGSPVTFDPC